MKHSRSFGLLLCTLITSCQKQPSSRIEIVKELKPCSVFAEQKDPIKLDRTTTVASSGCKRKLSISMKIQNIGKTFTKSQFILVHTAHDSILKREVKLRNYVILKIRQEEVTVAYPFNYMYFVNNKAYEFIVHKDNKNQYAGCYDDNSVRRMCGGNERVSSNIRGFCCKCSNQSSQLYHMRGGQTCHGHDKDDGYYASTHCLMFDPLWYSVNSLGRPRIQHAIHITAYVDGKQKSADIRVGTDMRHSSALNKKMRSKYTVISKHTTTLEDFSKKRLLIPELVTVTKEKQKAFLQLQRGSEEFMLVDEKAINNTGSECNKIGVSYKAFTSQSNRCQHQAHRCLENQPMHLWLHDEQKSIEAQKGSYFLKFHAVLPEKPVIKHKHTNEKLLMLQYMPEFVSHLHMEMAADEVTVMRPGMFGRIIQVVSIAKGTTSTISVHVQNTGVVSSTYSIQLDSCTEPLNGIQQERTDHVLVAPLQTHVYVLRVTLQESVPADRSIICTVQLVNEEQKMISERRLSYQIHDRCVCMGQCKCRCLSHNNLHCEHLTRHEYKSAGYTDMMPLSASSLTRWHQQLIYGLSICILVNIVFVLIGLAKLASDKYISHDIGSFGLSFWRDEPFVHYYERELRNQQVIYDSAGQPVHPVTGFSIYRMSPFKQHVLNVCFVFCVPFICGVHVWNVACRHIQKVQARRRENAGSNVGVKYSSLVQDLKDVKYDAQLTCDDRHTLSSYYKPNDSTVDRMTWSSDEEVVSDCTSTRLGATCNAERRNRHPSGTTSTTSTLTNSLRFSRSDIHYFSATEQNRNASSNVIPWNPLIEYQIEQLNKLVESKVVVFYNFLEQSAYLKNSGQQFSLAGKLAYNSSNTYTFSLGTNQKQVYQIKGVKVKALLKPLPIRCRYFRKRLTAKTAYEHTSEQPLYPCLNILMTAITN